MRPRLPHAPAQLLEELRAVLGGVAQDRQGPLLQSPAREEALPGAPDLLDRFVMAPLPDLHQLLLQHLPFVRDLPGRGIHGGLEGRVERDHGALDPLHALDPPRALLLEELGEVHGQEPGQRLPDHPFHVPRQGVPGNPEPL